MIRDGRLIWGGCDAAELARRFGTPLYVIDEGMVRERISRIRSGFLEKWDNTQAVYAGKAFLPLAMCALVASEGLGLDMVSGGEIHAASAAGFPMERGYFHGNSKTRAELEYALDARVGRIVVDGVMELEQLRDIAAMKGRSADILIRVAPGVDAHTHRYVITGHTGSKFGVPLIGDSLERCVELCGGAKDLRLHGFHFHVGSQIYENTSHLLAVDILLEHMSELRKLYGFETEELNVGGGFGVASLPGERTPAIGTFTDPLMERITARCAEYGVKRPKVIIEPGRWLISEAGITLYGVTTVKRIPGIVTHVGVDGGMTDNPRPALYGAKYSALLAERADAPAAGKVSIVGKCCETGDILAEGVDLPETGPGDILAMLNTGAYTFSMANNYNMTPRPAVVFVRDGTAEVVVRRQTYDDLIRGQSVPEHLARNA
jgi:diaminopimelate decarboxylase